MVPPSLLLLPMLFLCADGSCTPRSASFLSAWRITWLLFAVTEDQVFNASPLLFQYYEPPLSLICKLCGAKQFHVCIVVLHEHVQMPCPGPNSFLHVTLVMSRRILISAQEAARPFGHYAMQNRSFSSQALHFVMRAVSRINLLFQRWPNSRFFYSWTRLFCCFASKHMSLVLLFLIAADVFFFSTDQVAQVATTRTRLVAEQMCCTSASQHHCVLLNDVQLFLPSSLNFGVASMGTMCDLHEEHLSASDDEEEDHKIWDVFLNLVTSFDFGARIQSNLADEELGRVGPSCHYAMDCLCAELYALCGLLDHDWHSFGLVRRVQASASTIFSHEGTARAYF